MAPGESIIRCRCHPWRATWIGSNPPRVWSAFRVEANAVPHRRKFIGLPSQEAFLSGSETDWKSERIEFVSFRKTWQQTRTEMHPPRRSAPFMDPVVGDGRLRNSRRPMRNDGIERLWRSIRPFWRRLRSIDAHCGVGLSRPGRRTGQRTSIARGWRRKAVSGAVRSPERFAHLSRAQIPEPPP